MCYFNIILNIFSWSTADVFLRELLANTLAKKLGSTKFENKGRKEIQNLPNITVKFLAGFSKIWG